MLDEEGLMYFTYVNLPDFIVVNLTRLIMVSRQTRKRKNKHNLPNKEEIGKKLTDQIGKLAMGVGWLAEKYFNQEI